MGKSLVCLVSAGVLMFLSCGNADALFGKSKVKETVATKTFGEDISSITKTTKDINNTITSADKQVNSSAKKLVSISMDTKTFDTNTEVGTPLIIAANLEIVANFLDKISQSLLLQNKGFTAYGKSKSDGDAKAQEGRKLFIQSVKTLAVAEPLLAMLRANIAVTGQFFAKKKSRVNNTGATVKAMQDLAKVISDRKKTFGGTARGLVSMATDYISEFESIAEGVNDVELGGWLKTGRKYVESLQEIIILFDTFITRAQKYLEDADPSEIVELGTECSAKISNLSTTLKQQKDTRKEVRDLKSKRLVSNATEEDYGEVSNVYENRAMVSRRQKETREELKSLKKSGAVSKRLSELKQRQKVEEDEDELDDGDDEEEEEVRPVKKQNDKNRTSAAKTKLKATGKILSTKKKKRAIEDA